MTTHRAIPFSASCTLIVSQPTADRAEFVLNSSSRLCFSIFEIWKFPIYFIFFFLENLFKIQISFKEDRSMFSLPDFLRRFEKLVSFNCLIFRDNLFLDVIFIFRFFFCQAIWRVIEITFISIQFVLNNLFSCFQI
jgi:hypothetical protein